MVGAREAIGLFLLLTVVGCAGYFLKVAPTLTMFYGFCVFLGFTIGYWAARRVRKAEIQREAGHAATKAAEIASAGEP